MKKILLSGVMLWIAVMLFSCKGDTGATGPAGAANVTPYDYSDVTWNDVNDNETEFQAVLAVPEITADNLSNCAVMVYLSADGGADWQGLPYELTSTEWNFTYTIGYVTVTETNLQQGEVPSPDGDDVKVVVIPPSEEAVMKSHHVNMNDYNQVKPYLSSNSNSN